MSDNLDSNLIREEIQHLRTLIITSVAGSFAVLVAAFGTDKMLTAMAAAIPKLEILPKGAIVLALWLLALLFLGLAFRHLSPSNVESPIRLFEDFKKIYESLENGLPDPDKKAFEARLSKKKQAVEVSTRKAYRYTSLSFVALSCSAIVEFVIGLQIF